MATKRRPRKPTAAVHKHASGATAAHLKTNDADVVAYDNLHVLITKEDGRWVARGLEIDYAIDGKDIPEVKRKFEEGLAASFESNLKAHGSIVPLLRVAPQETWAQYFDQSHVLHRHVHRQVVTHRLQEHLPFEQISWIEKRDIA